MPYDGDDGTNEEEPGGGYKGSVVIVTEKNSVRRSQLCDSKYLSYC